MSQVYLVFGISRGCHVRFRSLLTVMSDGAAAAPIKAAGPDAATGGAGAVQIHMMALSDFLVGRKVTQRVRLSLARTPRSPPRPPPDAAPAAVVADEDADEAEDTEGGVNAPVDFESNALKYKYKYKIYL